MSSLSIIIIAFVFIEIAVLICFNLAIAVTNQMKCKSIVCSRLMRCFGSKVYLLVRQIVLTILLSHSIIEMSFYAYTMLDQAVVLYTPELVHAQHNSFISGFALILSLAVPHLFRQNYNQSNVVDCAIKVISIKRQGWIYRGEGNANVVLWSQYYRRLLRLRKAEWNGQKRAFNKKVRNNSSKLRLVTILIKMIDFNYKDNNLAKSESKVLLQQIYFKVMSSLIGQTYSDATNIQPIRIELDDVSYLNSALSHERPEKRLHKGFGRHCVGHLMEDYAFLPKELCADFKKQRTFCVEIKPKAWRAFKLKDATTTPYFKCCFSLLQYLKLKTGQVKQTSHYCPLDLFSGNKVRMKKAIRNLLDTPQNNLKMFCDGDLHFDNERSENTYENMLKDWFSDAKDVTYVYKREYVLDMFCEFISEVLLTDMKEPRSLVKYKQNLPISCAKPIQEVLEKLRKINIEGCCEHVDYISAPIDCVISRLVKVQLLDVGIQLKKTTDTLEYLPGLCSKFQKNKSSEDFLKNCTAAEKYMLAATAKDASIMITFRILDRISEEDEINYKNNIFRCHGKIFVCKVSVIDLDPKSDICLKKQLSQYKKIIRACKDYLNGQ